MLPVKPAQIKKHCVIIPLLVIVTTVSNGQGLLGKVKKTMQDATEIAYQAAMFTKLAGMTTAEFNKTVKVIKGDESTSQSANNGKITKPQIKNGEFKNLTWSPITYFDRHLFPSCIIGMATYRGEIKGEEMKALINPIGFRLKSKYSNMPIKWEIECSDKRFFDKRSGNATYSTSDQEVFLMPDIPWSYELLSRQLSSTPIDIYFRLFDEEGNKVEKMESLVMRSINDCIYKYKDNNLDFLFTAYIQEEHPEIDKIIKEATNTKFVPSIKGYQGNNPNYTDWQVASIWKVLHDRGFNYSSITTTAIENTKELRSQSVRTFNSSINTNQANCVDGSIVFASILRKIGIHSVLVMTNDHCFLGYYRKEDSLGKRQDIVYLETTALANSRYIDEAKTKAKIENAKTDEEKKKADEIIKQGYIDQFLLALEKGKNNYDEYKLSQTKGKFIEAEIDVDLFRKWIIPIPF